MHTLLDFLGCTLKVNTTVFPQHHKNLTQQKGDKKQLRHGPLSLKHIRENNIFPTKTAIILAPAFDFSNSFLVSTLDNKRWLSELCSDLKYIEQTAIRHRADAQKKHRLCGRGTYRPRALVEKETPESRVSTRSRLSTGSRVSTESRVSTRYSSSSSNFSGGESKCPAYWVSIWKKVLVVMGGDMFTVNQKEEFIKTRLKRRGVK